MINFLVKLANLLDTRGQYAMAREVDDLIEKLGQSTTWLDSWYADNKKVKPLLLQLKNLIAVEDQESLGNSKKQILKKLDESIRWIDEMSRESITDDDINQGNQWWEYLGTNVFNPIQEAIDAGNLSNNFGSKYYGIKEETGKLFNDIARTSDGARKILANPPAQPAKTEAPPAMPGKPAEAPQPTAAPGEASKTPAPAEKKKHAPSARTQFMVAQIQKNLGMTQTGQWDKETNKKFVELMNSQPEYAKMMQGGKFNGNLQQAVQMTSNLAMLGEKEPKQEDVASKAPTEPVKQEDDFETPGQKMWKSKYFTLTPAAMTSLRELDRKRGPGAGQRLIDIFDKTPNQTQQTFEQILADRAAQK